MNINEVLAKKYERNSEFIEELNNNGISILQGYRSNKTNINKFYNYFYKEGYPKIVLCGINPGKNGAGQTGIPFIDFDTLNEIFIKIFGESNIQWRNTEPSAQFIKYVIEHFEGKYNIFFKYFYLTNYSFLGYTNGGNNINYYSLPIKAKTFIDSMFIYEMNIIRPSIIIPLSEEVEISLNLLQQKKCLDYSIDKRLAHPAYCNSRRNRKLNEYLSRLNSYIKV